MYEVAGNIGSGMRSETKFRFLEISEQPIARAHKSFLKLHVLIKVTASFLSAHWNRKRLVDNCRKYI